MPKLSAYILTLNEEDKIGDAIRSVLWADEIVVADSGSTDRTVAISEELGARVVQIPFQSFGQLRNDAIQACTHAWIFSLDADERCTPAAEHEISQIVASTDARDAYYVPRKNWFMGRWIKHGGWYPDYRQPQLFRQGALSFETADEVHESYQIHGSKGYCTHAIHQIPYKDLEQLLYKANRYSSLGALKLARKDTQASMCSAFLHGIAAFVRIYILKFGFLDGWPGFVIALGNFEGTFYRYAKLVSTQKSLFRKPPPSE